jgi:hypothetical protein
MSEAEFEYNIEMIEKYIDCIKNDIIIPKDISDFMDDYYKNYDSQPIKNGQTFFSNIDDQIAKLIK